MRLTPAAVKNEVDLLKRFSGARENAVLESLEYTSGPNSSLLSSGHIIVITHSG